MIYRLFWTAYSIKVNTKDFERFFGVPLKKMYGIELWIAKLPGFVTEKNDTYAMTLKGAFPDKIELCKDGERLCQIKFFVNVIIPCL